MPRLVPSRFHPAGTCRCRCLRTNGVGTVVRLNSRTESSIWLVDLIKGGATPLVQAAGLNDSVVWSPDGGRIVF